nr:unnamed protein product [Callosobruchus chinensis]
MVTLLKELSFNDGLQLVNRFSKKRVKISKIWKNCNRIAIFATQMYISQLLLRYSNDLQSTLEEYIELYISLCDPDNLEDFSDSIRRIKMYIRALTSDMNELERHKDANDTEKVQIITQRLANAFVSLAHVLDEHVNVARECVLTAFSLAPTSDKLKKIEELARRSGYQVVLSRDEWKCKLHPPVLPSDDVTWICTQCGDLMCKPSLELPKINIALHEALQNSVLGISEALCDDLVVCLSNPRYQVLSWFLPWNDLHRICLMYLEDPQKTKSIVTELKFIDIDYSIFQNIKKEPEEEGIERGYEQYIEPDEESVSNSVDSMSQESRPYSLGSDGAGDNVFLSRLPSIPQKSDPNTLKSLRMFRPNLKRVKEKDLGESSPEKLFKPCTIVRESQASTSHQNLSSGSSEVLPSTSSTGKSIDESKNVKTATLPQLGGQVARTQIKATQKRQKLTLKDLLTSSMNPAHREPRKLSKKSSTSAEQTHNQETQNKSLLIGSKGNNKQKLSKEEKANPQKPLKLVVEIPREDLQQRKMTLIRQHSVLPSKQGSVIRPSEQTTSTKSPPLVVKVPLIRYPPHPRHRKATLAMQNSTQQIKSVEELRLPPLAPLSTQQKINSHTSATQLIILLQQKSQSASQALTPAHIQTGSKQGSLCLTESSSKEYPSLLDNQPKAPVTANTHQAGPSCSYQQSLLPGNIVGYQPVTLPQTQSEISLTTQVAGVVSTSQIVQETVDDIFQPTAQGISFSPINPAVPQSDSLSPTEQGELVRLEDSLIESRDLQGGKEILAHMQEIQEINKSLQREQSPHPTLLLKHLQPVEAAPTCPGIKSLPTSQEQNPDSYPDPTPAEWFPLVPCLRTTSLKSQETSVAPPKHPQPVGAFSEIRSPLKEMNLAPQQKSIADSPPLVTTEVNHQSSREQTMDSSLRQPSSSDSFQQLISRLPEPSPQMVPTLEEALSGLFPCPTIAAMECPTPITSETECQGTSRVITDDVSQTTGKRKKIWQGYNPPPVRFVTAQDTRLLHPETRATSQEAASHLQQLSPLSILIVDSPPPQTIVIADSPPPQTITSETESHLEKQGQPSAPTYQETSHLQTGIGPTPACPKQLRIVISPNTQKAASQFQAKRRSMSPVTEPQKHHCAKRVGQEDSSIALPRKRGRPRKKPVERRKTRISVPEKPPLLTIWIRYDFIFNYYVV